MRRRFTHALGIAVALVAIPGAAAPLGYPWLAAGTPASETLSQRIAPPPGFQRIPLARDHFGAWLRELPLMPSGAKVHLFTGAEKPDQRAQYAVVRLDVGARDLQQCADAVMRLRAEYLLARGAPIAFHPDGKHTLAFDPRAADPERKRFTRYLSQVFSDAGTASLAAELPKVTGPVLPGDVLIQGGHPGHAVLVLDVVADDHGKRRVMVGQSYMPAQEFHVLRNLADPQQGPWYDEAAIDGLFGLMTPEWPRGFKRTDVRRFP